MTSSSGKGDYCLDIGPQNIGGSFPGNGKKSRPLPEKVFCFEPGPMTFEALQKKTFTLTKDFSEILVLEKSGAVGQTRKPVLAPS